MFKKILFGITILSVIAFAFSYAVPAAHADGPGNPDPGGNASPSGQNHGAFNKNNLVYGTQSSPGNGDSLNSSEFGLSGGSGGSQGGPVGQEPGATGYNNSVNAPWGQTNNP